MSRVMCSETRWMQTPTLCGFSLAVLRAGRALRFAALCSLLLGPSAGAVQDEPALDNDVVGQVIPLSLANDARISGDGKFVVYEIFPTLVQISPPGIYVFDRAAGTSALVSVNDSGGAANNAVTEYVDINYDGRFIAFSSKATNLVGGDANAKYDVFVRDRLLSLTERVSVDSAESEGNGGSVESAISDDGRYVAFGSSATNLVAGDVNGRSDVFLRDRTLGTTELVSVDSDENQGNHHSGYQIAVSADGRFVAFQSLASNLVSGDTNGVRDVFVRDRVAGTTIRVSVDSAGNQGDGASGASLGITESYGPVMTPDGRYIAFTSEATNLAATDTNGDAWDVFVHDRVSGTTEHVSRFNEEAEHFAPSFDNNSRNPALSADGRFVMFNSTNPFTGKFNGGVFLYDRTIGRSRLLAAGERQGLTVFLAVALDLSADGLHALTWWNTGLALEDLDYSRLLIASDCGPVVCGDGTITVGCEQCDDGGAASLDGCSETCELELCHDCSGEPTVCTPHANGTSCEDNNTCTPGASTCSSGQCVGSDTCLAMLCPGSPDPCAVSGDVVLPAGGIVDLQGHALHFTESAEVSSSDNGGSFSFKNASQVTADPGSKLLAPGVGTAAGDIAIRGNGACTLGGEISAKGKVDRATEEGGDGGDILVRCSSVSATEATFDASAGGFGLGGEVSLQATLGDVALASTKLAALGESAFGGAVNFEASGNCVVQGKLDVRSLGFEEEGESTVSDGGRLEADCGGDVRLQKGTKISLSNAKEVTAGRLSLESRGGDVVIEKGVSITDHGWDYGGEGTVILRAANACVVGGKLKSSTIYGDAISTALECGSLTLSEKLKFEATSVASAGGTVHGVIDGPCQIDGKLILVGKGAKDDEGAFEPGEGGSLDLSCAGDINVSGKAKVDVTGKGGDGVQGSLGGEISLESTGGDVLVGGKLIAKGGGTGGSTSIAGCDVTIGGGGKVLADGSIGGANVVVAREALAVNGSLSAQGDTPGSNDVSYRATAAVLNPGLIEPAAVPTQDLGLAPCP